MFALAIGFRRRVDAGGPMDKCSSSPTARADRDRCDGRLIARKLERSPSGIYSRVSSSKKTPRERSMRNAFRFLWERALTFAKALSDIERNSANNAISPAR
jgi:hypothetical protein